MNELGQLLWHLTDLWTELLSCKKCPLSPHMSLVASRAAQTGYYQLSTSCCEGLVLLAWYGSGKENWWRL